MTTRDGEGVVMLVKGWQARLQRVNGRSRGTRPGGPATNGVTLGAVTLIVIQLLWMGTLLARSYFRQDDDFSTSTGRWPAASPGNT